MMDDGNLDGNFDGNLDGNFDGNFDENFDGNLMGILSMDSMGWPYDSFVCLSFIQEFGTDCFCLVLPNFGSLAHMIWE